MANKKFLVDLNLLGNRVIGAGNAVDSQDLVTKQQLDSVQAGLAWRPSVLGIQLDATLEPTIVEGARYIIGDPNNLHNAFGTIDDLAKNDIVEHNSDGVFVISFDASVLGDGYAVINKDTDSMYVFDGTNWEQKSTDHVSADGVTLQKDGSDVMSVKDGGIGNDQLGANSVTGDKIANNEITTAKISPLNIDASLLASNAVTSVKIATDAVTKEKLAADVAGSGLAQNIDGSIELADGYSVVVGDGASSDIPVTHNLNTKAVIVQLYDATTFEDTSCAITRDSLNSITLGFNTAPAFESLIVVIKAVL